MAFLNLLKRIATAPFMLGFLVVGDLMTDSLDPSGPQGPGVWACWWTWLKTGKLPD
jgi:hypothetical protein